MNWLSTTALLLFAHIAGYNVELTLDFARQTIAADETITIDGPARAVDLAAEDIVVSDVSDAGEPLAFEQQAGRLRFTITHAAPRVIRIHYAGKPARGLRFSAADQAFTAFHTGHWMVCDDDPSHKAPLSLALVLPKGLDAVAIGSEVGRDELTDGRVRWRFRQERPYSAYLFGFAVAPMKEADVKAGYVALRFVSPSFTQDELRSMFRETAEILAFFEEHSGVAFPGTTYTQALMPNGPAQEMAGLSVMSERYGKSLLEDPREDYLIAHELAHQWWGNLVTCRTWSDFWLNEGMATFMAAAAKERLWGRDEYERELVMARLRYFGALAKGERRPLVYSAWKTADEMGGPVTYSKGALVLHLLRTQLGERAFWNGLRAFTRAGAGRNVDSDDLRRAMDNASGKDLRRFFSQWVTGAPPELVARHRIVPHGVEVEITQKQAQTFTFSLDIAVTGGSRQIVRRVTVTDRVQTFRFDIEQPVVSVTVDANGELPDPIAHERPVSMLLAQLASNCSLAVRVDALGAAEAACTAAANQAGCAAFPAALAKAAALDDSRLVRALAAQTLERLRVKNQFPTTEAQRTQRQQVLLSVLSVSLW